MWIAGGDTNTGRQPLAISSDGINWSVPPVQPAYGNSNQVSGVGSNPQIGPVVLDSVITLNANSYPQTSNLDIVSDNYYNNGYTNFSMNINSSES